jgi:DNA-binding GntR family transcriptional regulator
MTSNPSRTATPDESMLEATTAISTPDQVAVAIRRLILSGELHPGEQFSLRNIAKTLGVSFIPVREALRSLEQQGLVVTAPGKSAMVAPLDRDDLRSIYRLRMRLEPEIAYRSCELLTSKDFGRLEDFLDEFSDETCGLNEIYESHHDFHVELLRPAATAWDLRILESLWHAAERYVRYTFSGLDSAPGEHQRREQSHRILVDTFRSRDPERSAMALRQHLEANEQIALKALSQWPGQ